MAIFTTTMILIPDPVVAATSSLDGGRRGGDRLQLVNALRALEDPGCEASLRVSAQANKEEERQRIGTPYGEILWRWSRSGDFLEETLSRSDLQFTVVMDRMDSRITRLSDSGGGGFVIRKDRFGRILELKELRGGSLVEREYSNTDGRLLRETFAGQVSISYAYGAGGKSWVERQLRDAAGTIQVREMNAGPLSAQLRRPAPFLNASDLTMLETSFLDARSPKPHGLVVARAGVRRGLLFASISSTTYAAIVPGTAEVAYRRFQLPDAAGLNEGTDHEVLLTDEFVWIMVGTRAESPQRILRLSRSGGRAPNLVQHVGLPEASMVGTHCAWVTPCVEAGSAGSVQEVCYEPYLDCLFWGGGGSGGGGGTGGGGTGGGGGGGEGTGEPFVPLTPEQSQAAEAARNTAISRLLERIPCGDLFRGLGVSGTDILGRAVLRHGTATDAACSPGVMAHATVGGGADGCITLCGGFFDLYWEAQAGTLVHEGLHLAGGCHVEENPQCIGQDYFGLIDQACELRTP